MFWNFIDLIFIYFILTIVILGALINECESSLPAIIVQTFRYGKHAYNGIPSKLVSKCEIPKSYFKHFYAFAIIWSILVFALASFIYALEWTTTAPKWLIACLDVLCGNNRTVASSPLATYAAITLLTLQCAKRFYETHWIQVFSAHSKMNLTHYAVGYFHYFGALLVIIAHGPGFTKDSIGHKHSITMSLNQLNIIQYLAVGVFLFSLIQQHRCNLTLANLRKNKSGAVVNEKHLLPKGHFFEYLSAPHMTFEILLYVALAILLPTNPSWYLVLFWVFSNQVANACLTHKWYLEHFKEYKEYRRWAVIPYLL